MVDDRARKAAVIALAALILAADAQSKLHKRDRWKRKLKDALWSLL